MIFSLPQIWLNYRLQSGSGISDGMLFGLLNMAACGLLFVYCAPMPIVYRISSPISLLTIIILIAQRAYYNPGNRSRFIVFFCINIVLLLILGSFAIKYPVMLAEITGWTSFAFQFLYQFPQLFKIIRSKSVYGFSLSSLSLQTFGYACELGAAIILSLPLAVKANDLRAIVMYGIFLVFFWRYQKKGN
jgi:hypothetical protein